MQPEPSPPGSSLGGSAPPKARANLVAAMIAGGLAVLTACMLIWFVLYNVVFAMAATGGGLAPVVVVNLIAGVLAIGALVVTAAFTFARRIPGAWTLCGVSAFYVVAMLLGAPLVFGTPVVDQFRWIFSFEKSNGVAIALAVLFCALTAIAAAVAASVKSYGRVSR